MKMKILLLFYFVSAVRSISYTRTRFLDNNPDTVLHYDLKNGLFIFKLEAAGREKFQIGLAFATKMDTPQDGFIISDSNSITNSNAEKNVVDLGLNSSDQTRGIYVMKQDLTSKTVINSLNMTNIEGKQEKKWVIEGHRLLSTCQGDIFKLFLLYGEDIFDSETKSLTIDRNQKSKFEEFYITLFTNVQESIKESLNNISSIKSKKIQLENHRPNANGDEMCRILRRPSSAKHYVGFIPLITGYNGNNGLLKQITLYQCKEKLKSKMSTDCNADLKAECSKILFLWTPTSNGEKFPENFGLFVEEGSLLLEVIYNPGTGWLYDASGLELFYHYSSEQPKKEVSKILLKANKNYGVCSSECFKEKRRLISVILSADGGNDTNNDVILSSKDEIITSGYRADFQPIRQISNEIRIEDLHLRCSNQDASEDNCWALVTIEGPMNATQCGSNEEHEAYCTIYKNIISLGYRKPESIKDQGSCSTTTGNDIMRPNSKILSDPTEKINDVDFDDITSETTTESNIIKALIDPTLDVSGELEDYDESSQDLLINANSISEDSENHNHDNQEEKTVNHDSQEENTYIEEEIDVEQTTLFSLYNVFELSNVSLSDETTMKHMNNTEDVTEIEVDLIEDKSNQNAEVMNEDDDMTTAVVTDILMNGTRESRLLNSPTEVTRSDGEIKFQKIYRSTATTITTNQCLHISFYLVIATYVIF